mgnify:CR=1 FL=1
MSERENRSAAIRRDPDLGRLFDCVIANRHGVSVVTVYRIRLELGIPSASSTLKGHHASTN